MNNAPQMRKETKRTFRILPFLGRVDDEKESGSYPNRFSEGENGFGRKRDFSNVSPYDFLWESALSVSKNDVFDTHHAG